MYNVTAVTFSVGVNEMVVRGIIIFYYLFNSVMVYVFLFGFNLKMFARIID